MYIHIYDIICACKVDFANRGREGVLGDTI